MRWARAAAVAVLVTVLAMSAMVLTGLVTVVTTHGVSMEPQFRTGDLAVVRAAPDYRVGDVVAYSSDLLGTVVMHRVVAVDGGRYTLRADNNSWLDPERPSREQLIGKLAVRIPQGGLWLDRLTSPAALAGAAFVLMAAGTAVRTRPLRRKKTMARHARQRSRRTVSVTTLPPFVRTAAAITAVTAVAATALGAFAWAGPLQTTATSVSTTEHQMAFAYSADVPRTPAYDDTVVTSPDPVFRTLVDAVDVRFSYQGEPGSVEVNAEISTGTGWRSTVPLAEPVRFTGDRYEDTVTLDLDALDARAQAAAEVTGLPADQLTVSVVPTVTTSDGDVFEPALGLRLTPLVLAPADAGALTAQTSTAAEQPQAQPRTLDLLGLSISAELARALAVALAAASVLAAVVLAGLARWTAPASEAAGIRRRYAPLLVAVQPVSTPPGRPVVDVTEFATLAKLAERYGLLVLHWSRSGVGTFVVQDEGTTYRYRTGLGELPEASSPGASDHSVSEQSGARDAQNGTAVRA